jgi:hypothetical protein
MGAEEISLIFTSLAEIFRWISWPIAIYLSLYLLRKPIENSLLTLCERINKVGRDGLIFNIAGQKSETKPIKDQININSELHDSLSAQSIQNNSLDEFPLINFYVEKMGNEIEDGANNHRGGASEYYKARIIEFYLAWQFEKIYRLIFGSQISFLRHLGSGLIN